MERLDVADFAWNFFKFNNRKVFYQQDKFGILFKNKFG